MNSDQRNTAHGGSPTPRGPFTRWEWILYGSALLIIMAITEYGDLQLNSFVANIAGMGHWNVYSYFGHTPSLRPIATVMPPVYYLTTGIYLGLLHLVHLDPVPAHPRFLYRYIFDVTRGWPVFWGLVLLKIPNLVALIVGTWALVRLGSRVNCSSRTLARLWLMSPIVIVESFMQAQMDIMPATLTILALLAYERDKEWKMFAWLGIAAAFQIYPLLFVPPTALLLGNGNFGRAIKWGFIAAIPFLLSLVPFLGHDLITRVFLAKNGTSLFTSVRLGLIPIHLWLLIYAVICYTAWRLGTRSVFKNLTLAVSFTWMSVCFSIFMFAYWLPQWVVWVVPMAVLFAARDAKFLLWWTVENVLFLANNLLAYPRNLDGQLLAMLFGHDVLWTYPQLVGPHGPTLIYTLLIAGFGALIYQAFRISQSSRDVAAPFLTLRWYMPPLFFYIAALCAQQLLPLPPGLGSILTLH